MQPSKVFFKGDVVVSRDPGEMTFEVQEVSFKAPGEAPALLSPTGDWYDGFWFELVSDGTSKHDLTARLGPP
jgi:hypothetical protein